MWIARDDYGLWLFTKEPIKTVVNGDKYFFKRDNTRYSIDSKLFPEITFENSPKKIRFELVENDIIEKACKWLNDNLYTTYGMFDNVGINSVDGYTVEELIEEFRKAMKTLLKTKNYNYV